MINLLKMEKLRLWWKNIGQHHFHPRPVLWKLQFLKLLGTHEREKSSFEKYQPWSNVFVTSQEKPEKWGISSAGRWKVIKEVVISRFYSTAMFQCWTLCLAQALNQTPVPRKYSHFSYFSSPFKKIFSKGAQQTSHHICLLNKAVGRWKVEEPGPTPHAQCFQES